MHSPLQPAAQIKLCMCLCMHVFAFENEKNICWPICAGMSDDWMIYSSELYEK